jgi:PKD repeat protein
VRTTLLLVLSFLFNYASAQCELNVEVSQESDCNTLILHAGNYPEDALIHWLINEELHGTGPSATFELSNGVYQICALYETPECPIAVTWCETFTINCEGECDGNLISLGIDSYMNNGGVSFTAWSLVNQFGQSVANGVAQFSPMDPYFDETVCVPDGCYTLVMQHDGENLNNENFHVYIGYQGVVLDYDVIHEPGVTVTSLFGINSDCANNQDCSDSLWSFQSGEDCLHWSFELGGFQPGETAIWYFGDGSIVEGGHFVSHIFDQPGLYTVCVHYSSDLCEGIEVCTQVFVEDCVNPSCNLDVEIAQQDCNLFVISALDTPENAQVYWTLNGDQFNIGNVSTFLLEDGVYEICAMYETPECPEGVFWCETFEVNCNQECIEMSMVVVSNVFLGGPAQVVWSIVDENMMSVDNGVLLFNQDTQTLGVSRCLEPGCYNIILQYDGGENPMSLQVTVFVSGEPVGVEILQENGYMNIGPIGLGTNCGDQDCPMDMYSAHGEDCAFWTFEVGGFQPGESAVWNFGDGTIVDGGHFITHHYENPGVYEVCVNFTSELCDGVEVCIVIVVGEECFTECNLEVIIASQTCESVIMQAVNFPEGAIIHWTLDGEFYAEGPPVSFFIADGVHQICAVYETPECPEGVHWCETFEFGCEEECTNVVVSVDSFVGEGGPGFVAWSIVDQNNMSVATGESEYNPNDPYYDHIVCLEDGCYSLVLQFNNFLNLEALNFGIYLNGISLDLETEVYPGYIIAGPFGINTDCGNEQPCEAFFNFENIEGNVFAFDNLSFPGEGANYYWHFGDGSTSDAVNPVHTFDGPGEYEVCLTVSIEGCENTYCQVISIAEENCTDFVITLQSEDIALGLLTWELLSDDLNLDGEIPLELIPEDGLSLAFCVPNGCYAFEFTWGGLESIIWEMILNDLINQLGQDVDMVISENSVLIEFGVGQDCVEGISAVENNALVVYPVPAQTTLQVNIFDAQQQSAAIIYDMAGKMVWEGFLNQGSNQIDVSALSAGLYQLNVTGSAGIQTKRIAISK